MTRLQRLATFNLGIALVFIALVVSLSHFMGLELVPLGMCVFLVLCLNRWLFKGRGAPEWDERERKIALKSALLGYWILWVFVVFSAFLYPAIKGHLANIPIWYLMLYGLLGVYVLVTATSLALLWFAREPAGGWARLIGFCLLVVSLAGPPVAAAALLARKHTIHFAGSYQADEWRVTAGGEIVARSRITLTRWPKHSRAMPIVLPYDEAEVESATFGGKTLEVHKLKQGEYAIELPERFIAPFDMTVEVVWKVPLAALEEKPDPKYGPYHARLTSLIPVSSRSLKVVLEPGCGFVIAGVPDRRWTYPFAWMRGDGTQFRTHGSCSLCIRRIGANREKPKHAATSPASP